jgi:hypothetical protein
MKVKTEENFMTTSRINFENDCGFELIQTEELFLPDNFQETTPEVKESLTAQRFFEMMDKHGKIKDVNLFKKIIFTFGSTEEIRPQIWKYLLKL